MKTSKYLLGSLMIPMMGLMACSDNIGENNSGTLELDENGMATVSINVSTEAGSSRASLANSPYNISKGDMIDVLVFEVYEVTTDGEDKTYTPLDYYKSVDSKFESTIGSRLSSSESALAFNAKTGKTLVLKVNPDKEYAIAFWAQDSDCTAYTLNVSENNEYLGLKKVTVNYDGIKNNDESRDAFSGMIEFSGHTRESLSTILYRPFAQVNVGTTGADFITSSKAVGGTYYTYSKMEVSGVANTLNVLTDEIGGVMMDGGAYKTVTLDWAPLAAWINESSIPSAIATGTGLAPIVKTENEQFLTVNLDNDPEILPFLTSYNTIRKSDDGKTEYLTETFKYLSMSYLLVPSTVKTEGASSGNGGATLSNLKVSFANEKGIDADDSNDTASLTGFSLNNVPVNRNWRTNILGGLYAPYVKDPNDPNNPDDPDNPNNPDNPDDPNNPDPELPFDPSSTFSAVGVKVTLSTDYFGDEDPKILVSEVEAESIGAN